MTAPDGGFKVKVSLCEKGGLVYGVTCVYLSACECLRDTINIVMYVSIFDEHDFNMCPWIASGAD